MKKKPVKLEFITPAETGGAPPTPAELAWWREASKPERRRTLLLWIPWYTGLFTIPRLIRHPERFFAGEWMRDVLIGLGVGIVAGLLTWRLGSQKRFELRLAAKRIRDALIADN